MDHRRTPSRNAYVPASWFIVLTVMLCVGAAGWLGWLVVDHDSGTTNDATPSPSTTAPSATATTPSPEPTETTEPTPSPTPTEETTPAGRRDTPVSVLNNTTIRGLAQTYSVKVRGAGWTVAAVGNWRGSIVGNTVYYPPAFEQQGRLLAEDLGIERVLPSFSPMNLDRLTIILSGPQQ